jgi:dehydrogenase/reductase SDR family protein 7B
MPVNDTGFRGKVVWITGASSGIGEALARRFAQAGSHLILSSRREDELNRVKSLCAGAPSIAVLPLDLSKPERMSDAAARALELTGHVDVMIHNGGVSQRSFASDTSYDVDELLMRTNYLGPVALTKALLPSLQSRHQGHFIVVTSVLGKIGLPGRSGYCASKHALHGFFDTVRAEFRRDGIRVTLVLPGWVRTNVSINALTGSGKPNGKMETGTAGGVTPEFCAERIIAGAAAGKADVNVVRATERFALYLNRLTPSLFRRLIRDREL